MFTKIYNYYKKFHRELLIVLLTLFSISTTLFYFNDRNEIMKCHKQLKQKDENLLLLHDSIFVLQTQYMRLENSIDILLQENPKIEIRYNQIYNHETE